jgi:hypothetical protein
MSTKRIWYSETEYIGSTGYDTVRELAEAMLATPDFRDTFEDNDDPQSLDQAEAYLTSEGARVDHVPVSVFGKEVWDSNFVRERMPFDDKPGRGYIRVLGVNL